MNILYRTLLFIYCGTGIVAMEQCSVVRPGLVGFKQRLGKLDEKPIAQGRKFINPFTTRIVKINTRISDYSATLHLPSKEGLEINADVTLLYHVKPDDAFDVYTKIGTDYEKRIVITNFNAIAREVCVRFYAQELITQKDSLEQGINKKLIPILASYGITPDQVIVRDIDLPDEILQAIRNKVTAEQTALQTAVDIEKQKKEFEFDLEKQREQAEFSVEKQKKEAERMLIEAQATKRANDSLNQSLTDRILKLKSIEATRDALHSNNAKLIITDGKSPVSVYSDGIMGTK